jgi:hypothetical protein
MVSKSTSNSAVFPLLPIAHRQGTLCGICVDVRVEDQTISPFADELSSAPVAGGISHLLLLKNALGSRIAVVPGWSPIRQ